MSLIAFILITSLLVVASAVAIDVSTNPYGKVVASIKQSVLLNRHKPLVKNRQPLRVSGAHRKTVI